MLGLMPPQGMKPPPIGRCWDLDARRKKEEGMRGEIEFVEEGGYLYSINV